jgi:pyridoxal phosphate enzyme (YggS family)
LTINHQNLDRVESFLVNFPKANLQIVTKNRDIDIIRNLINLGYTNFGENKVQEAKKKFSIINNPRLDLNLIGPLQTNKVKDALMLFNTIQTIDREKLVKEIVKVRLKTQTKTEYFYIQINIGEENQKSGIPLNETLDFYKFCIDNSLRIKGFMCIPPINNNPEYYFNKMLTLKNEINPNLLLSIGMSSDYESALKCNSNLIRIGSKIFN